MIKTNINVLAAACVAFVCIVIAICTIISNRK